MRRGLILDGHQFVHELIVDMEAAAGIQDGHIKALLAGTLHTVQREANCVHS